MKKLVVALALALALALVLGVIDLAPAEAEAEADGGPCPPGQVLLNPETGSGTGAGRATITVARICHVTDHEGVESTCPTRLGAGEGFWGVCFPPQTSEYYEKAIPLPCWCGGNGFLSPFGVGEFSLPKEAYPLP